MVSLPVPRPKTPETVPLPPPVSSTRFNALPLVLILAEILMALAADKVRVVEAPAVLVIALVTLILPASVPAEPIHRY